MNFPFTATPFCIKMPSEASAESSAWACTPEHGVKRLVEVGDEAALRNLGDVVQRLCCMVPGANQV